MTSDPLRLLRQAHSPLHNVKMYSNSDAAACNRRLGAKGSKEKACNPHEKEFFSLFDFDAESSSTKAETTDSPLKSIQGAASAVFGGIWSALDTAISILNEDMNMGDSLQEMTTSEHDGTYGDSLMDDHVDGYLEQSKKSSAIDAAAQNKEVEILSSVLEPLLGACQYSNRLRSYYVLNHHMLVCQPQLYAIFLIKIPVRLI